MENLNWLEKGSSRQLPSKGADVLVSVSKKHGNGNGKVYLSFYNGVEKKISDTGYIVIAIRGNRIYMKSSNAMDGYTLSNSGQKGRTKLAQITVPEEDYYFVKKGIGSYIIFEDNQLHLHYIELKQT